MLEQYNIPKHLRHKLGELLLIENNEKRWLSMKTFFYLHLPEYIDNRMAWKIFLETKSRSQNGQQ